MRVLLIEDDPHVRDSMAHILEHAGFTVTGVANGLAALAKLRDQRYSAIVCDLRLPFLGGNDLFTQVQELFPDMAERTVFVTGRADDPDALEFLENTGQPFLRKPFATDRLVTIVRQLAGKV